ncbi:MAG TPA: hypothetical protein VJX66_03005, partial [Amycolatopsis sp.]|nr:hypothetical protein [Amycolatopsis sp.]
MKRTLAAAVALMLAPGAAGAVAKPKHRSHRGVTAHVLTLTQQEARKSGVLRVEIRSKRDIDVRVRGYVLGKSTHLVAPTTVVDLPAGKRVNYPLRLSAGGRQLFGRNCRALTVRVLVLRGEKKRSIHADRKLPSTLKCPAGGGSGGKGGGNSPGPAYTYSIGLASRSIDPDPNGKWQGKNVYLGGYGISGGQPGGLDQGRAANGILAGGPSVTALALSDGTHPFALATIEVQGWFVANKDAPYGLVDMRKEVARETGGALKADQVLIQSDHTHGGADPMGVWGGVPLSFRKFMFDQTVAAIVDAWQHRTPVNLYYGWAPARDLQSNQFDYDTSNKVMDSDLRVLQARKSDGTPVATILDYSAHPTVLGSSNQHITGDWPQEANKLMAQRFGGQAMTIV